MTSTTCPPEVDQASESSQIGSRAARTEWQLGIGDEKRMLWELVANAAEEQSDIPEQAVCV
jgi:hypothetical protein